MSTTKLNGPKAVPIAGYPLWIALEKEYFMAMKDISDKQVCEAYAESMRQRDKTDRKEREFPYEILQRVTGQPEKVCYRAMERACDRDLIEYGVSLRTGWLTEKGKQLLEA